MAYTVPTAAQFKVRFPAFAAIADATVDAVIADALLFVDTSWIEADYAPAIMLYAAHLLTTEGLGATTEAQLSGFTSLSIGPLSLSRSASASALGSLGGTSFGQRFLDLLRRSHPAILAVNESA